VWASRSIRVAANANRRKVGVLKTEVELYGGFDFQTFQQKPRWLICDDLQLQYTSPLFQQPMVGRCRFELVPFVQSS